MKKTGICRECGCRYVVTTSGNMPAHRKRRVTGKPSKLFCKGSGEEPA